MNDIFLSYDSSDRAIAQQFSNVLEALGWSVWWDREIPHGKDFDLVIEQELNAARCAIVLWSKESVQSRWVRGEASAAAARDCLIPVLIEHVTLPLEFRQIQTAALIGWNGDTRDPEFVRLLDSLTKLIGREPQPSGSLPRRIAAPASRRRIVTGALAVAAIAAVVVTFALRDGRSITDERPHATSTSTSSDSAPVPTASVTTATGPSAQHVPIAHADALSIAIGDKIQEGTPGPGAGVIETAHAKDVYTFIAQRGQSAYFRVLNYDPALAAVEWKLIDANEAEIFRACLGCSDPGVQNLRTGGRYTLIVGSDREPGVGTYRLHLHDVPKPDRFKIAIGDVVAEEVTGRGAGVIESPGVEDVYSFEALPRQRVYFRVREHTAGIAQVRLRLLDANETQVFEGCLGCGEPGVQVLMRGGSYTLIVGIRNDPATGTYRLQLFDVPQPHQFTISIPAKIAEGIPSRGAGFIESPGAEDRYTFHVDAAQKLEIRLGEYERTLTYNQWRLLAEDGTELVSRCFGCSPLETLSVSRAGRYLLVVGNSREASTGTYAIEIMRK